MQPLPNSVLIIVNGNKGLPAVNGGGVEYLTQELIDGNIFKTIDVISQYNDKAFRRSKSEIKTNVTFYYVHMEHFIMKLKMVFWKLISFLFNKPFGNAFIHAASKIVDFNQYDLIISENGVNFGVYIRNKYKGKLILHLHNDWLNNGLKFSVQYKSSYDEIWAISSWLKSRIDDVYGDTNVKVLYNCININAFNLEYTKLNKTRLREQLNISSDDVVIATCSRIVPEKGILESIEAFNKYCSNNHDGKLLIIGDVSSNNSYVRKVKKKCVDNENIIITGWINHDNVREYLCMADIVLLPTLKNKNVFECFNLSLVETIALGAWAVASDNGGMPEILIDDYSTLVIEDDDIINSLKKGIDSAELKKLNTTEYKVRNKEYINRFSQTVYLNTIKEYISVL